MQNISFGQAIFRPIWAHRLKEIVALSLSLNFIWIKTHYSLSIGSNHHTANCGNSNGLFTEPKRGRRRDPALGIQPRTGELCCIDSTKPESLEHIIILTMSVSLVIYIGYYSSFPRIHRWWLKRKAESGKRKADSGKGKRIRKKID